MTSVDPQQPAQPQAPGFEPQPAQPFYEAYTPEVITPAYAPQQPTAAMPPVAPPKPKKTGLVVLSLFLVLFFGAAGAFGVLFFQEKSHSGDLSKQLEGKDREITDLTKKAKDSKDAAEKAVAAQKKAETDAASAQKCRDAAKALTAAALANDEGKGEAALKDMMLNC